MKIETEEGAFIVFISKEKRGVGENTLYRDSVVIKESNGIEYKVFYSESEAYDFIKEMRNQQNEPGIFTNSEHIFTIFDMKTGRLFEPNKPFLNNLTEKEKVMRYSNDRNDINMILEDEECEEDL
jgi:hypothetical protein